MAESSLQLQSTITPEGKLRLELAELDVPTPGPDDVVVQVQAAPINPSDLGLLLGPADLRGARQEGTAERPVIVADIPEQVMPALAARVGKAMFVGNEGAGVVVATGDSPAARALLGKTVALIGGGMYQQHRRVPAAACLVLPESVSPRQGASCFVNPLTTLCMLETMRAEGHSALVHTAAASNLGQMLHKLCAADGVSLVNVVRKPEQVELLSKLGAKYVINSEAASFKTDLVDAIAETGATLAFDAIGGGELAGRILAAMEAAANRRATDYSRYGSSTHKQVYIYGMLDRSPTILNRNFGMAWGLGGWLLTPRLGQFGARAEAMRARVVAEITTTFASHYTREISLREALTLDTLLGYARQATGEKYLINPSL
jgi:NADPH2:quinone reductase